MDHRIDFGAAPIGWQIMGLVGAAGVVFFFVFLLGTLFFLLSKIFDPIPPLVFCWFLRFLAFFSRVAYFAFHLRIFEFFLLMLFYVMIQ